MGYLIAVCVLVVISYLFNVYQKNGRRLPPGPWGLPIIGHLHMLGDLPHRNLQKLAKKYGPIMHIRFGFFPAVVVSSPEAAELVLKTHDTVFASRPKIQTSDLMSSGLSNLAFAQYGPEWRNVRKLCSKLLLSSATIESMNSMRKVYVMNLVRDLIHASSQGNVVDVSEKVKSLMVDMTFGMIIGPGNDARPGFKSSIKDIFRLAAAFNIADYVPFVGALDLQGLIRKMKVVSKRLDRFLEDIIDEHAQHAGEPKENDRDFIDIMLSAMSAEEQHLDRDTIKAIIIDMIAGAKDTSATAMEWAFSDLLRHPRVMKLVQSELESVVGLNRMVEDSDLMKLEYLDLVIKESMRLHPIAPLLLPHESREDITINGYFIPKNSRIIVNAWAIGHDQHVWSDNVDEFNPERFFGATMDFKGNDLRFIPFGSGRRGCPGTLLGLRVVRLVIAQLVHCFNWELPNGMSPLDLDMNEKFGLTLARTIPILAIPTLRLNIDKP
uniref:Cytochrome P450 n=1 Tax=Sinopodophyllum hexandrum TaxID=93608 RepID=A0A0N9HMQ0_SINHE|nr:cytochrome P450 [Sinopodophyllum hexandrum]